MKHEGNGDTSYNCCPWNGPQSLDKEIGRVDNRMMSRDHTNYSIAMIDENNENSGDMRRFVVT